MRTTSLTRVISYYMRPTKNGARKFSVPYHLLSHPVAHRHPCLCIVAVVLSKKLPTRAFRRTCDRSLSSLSTTTLNDCYCPLLVTPSMASRPTPMSPIYCLPL